MGYEVKVGHRYFSPDAAHKVFKVRYYPPESDFEHDGQVHEVPARLPDGQWAPHRAKGEKTECGLEADFRGYDILDDKVQTTCPGCLARAGQ